MANEFDPAASNNNPTGTRLPGHSGNVPVEQGGERPVREFDNTTLGEAMDDHIGVPDTVEEGFQTAPLTDEEQKEFEEWRRQRAQQESQAQAPAPQRQETTSTPESTKKSHRGLIGGIALGLAGAVAATGAYLGHSHKGGGKPEANPTSASAPLKPGQTGETTLIQSPTSTPEVSTPIDATTILKVTTFHKYVQEHPNDVEALRASAVAQVNVPSSEWESLPGADKATRMANYVEVTTAFCSTDIIGDNGDITNGQARLDAVDWSPYITKDLMTSALNGDKASLEKLETIRRMYACSAGVAMDAQGNYTPQIRENLEEEFYKRPANDSVNADDYATNVNTHSMLNTDELEKYGGSVHVIPAVTGVPFEGMTLIAPDAAWIRPPEVNPTNFTILPWETSTGKYIPSFQ